MNNGKKIVVVGGGIAAISCIEALFSEFSSNSINSSFTQVVLIASSRIVKKVVNYELTGRNLEKFDVIETQLHDAIQVPEGLKFRFIEAFVEEFDFKGKNIIFRLNQKLNHLTYDLLCMCLGAKPRQLEVVEKSCCKQVREATVLIRDSNSIKELEKKLLTCKKVLIVGNGGIGLELVHKITNCTKVWLVRNESIGLNFLDAGASKFLLESAGSTLSNVRKERDVFVSSQAGKAGDSTNIEGPSLGPYWLQNSRLEGSSGELDLKIIYRDEVKLVEECQETKTYLLKVTTKNGLCINCDLIVFGIGVIANTQLLNNSDLELAREQGGGIVIDNEMRTSVENVYAAGDVVSCKRWAKNELWFQMRLWTQARSMGFYAGRCIAAHLSDQDPSIYFNFDCFTHCTSFFNHKLILIGRYNQEELAHEVQVRVNHNKDYVKVLVNERGRIFGAVLVGESGLEETIENLIHDAIDISFLKDKLLDNTVDIEDYFD